MNWLTSQQTSQQGIYDSTQIRLRDTNIVPTASAERKAKILEPLYTY